MFISFGDIPKFTTYNIAQNSFKVSILVIDFFLDHERKRRRIRLRWHKAVTLVNNPDLVLEYIQKKLKRQKDRKRLIHEVFEDSEEGEDEVGKRRDGVIDAAVSVPAAIGAAMTVHSVV